MLIWAGLSLAMGGVLKGATGAGAPIVAVPVLTMIYGVDIAVTTLVVSNLLTNFWQAWVFRAQVMPRLFIWLFAGSGMAGVVVGTWLLTSLPPATLSLIVAVAVYAYIGFRMLRPDWKVGPAPGLRLAGPAGMLGGVMQGATGISAPVSITFLNALGLPRGVFIATISVFFVAMSVVQLVALATVGLMTWERLALSFGALGVIILFMPVGEWMGARFSKAAFDRVVLVLLGLIATRIIVEALRTGLA